VGEIQQAGKEKSRIGCWKGTPRQRGRLIQVGALLHQTGRHKWRKHGVLFFPNFGSWASYPALAKPELLSKARGTVCYFDLASGYGGGSGKW